MYDKTITFNTDHSVAFYAVIIAVLAFVIHLLVARWYDRRNRK